MVSIKEIMEESLGLPKGKIKSQEITIERKLNSESKFFFSQP